MIKFFFPLLMSLMLLWGCAAQNPQPEATAETVASTVSPTEALPGYPKIRDDDVTQCWTLPADVTGFLPMGENLILFCGTESTTLRLLNTQSMEETACYPTGFVLMSENFTIRPHKSGISYFDTPAMETVVLDQALQEILRIPAPEAMLGTPLLSSDGQTLYYCTADAIRALDLRSGISRILKQAAYPVQGLSGLLLGDTVLQVSITETSGQWRTLFLSTETGQLLQSYDGNVNPVTSDSSYLASIGEGTLQSVLFGHIDGATMALHPRDWGRVSFLCNRFQAVTASPVIEGTTLDLYDLDTGKRTASLTLSGFSATGSVSQAADGKIWILSMQEETGASVLTLWDPAASATDDSTQYSTPLYSRENPDYDGLAACSLLAQEIGQKHGIEVLIYRDAVEQQPWDYDLEYEYQVPVLRRELERLDQRLDHFPDGFLQTLCEKFTALKICIVRSAVGSPASGSLTAVNAIQFRDGYDAYIVLTTDHNTEYALYHELCHLMDTVILAGSTAYDRWEALNPLGFQYDNDYLANRNRDGSAWLVEGQEYFVDTYAMSYAKEDRARILEYAMTEGNAQRFASPHLQKKLKLLCTGIREAFGLEKSTETFLWEQYLLDN